MTQSIMAAGKSKVILPLLAFLNSRGDNVPIIVVPDMLYETNLEDMRIFSGEFFNQEVETIYFKEGIASQLPSAMRSLKSFSE